LIRRFSFGLVVCLGLVMCASGCASGTGSAPASPSRTAATPTPSPPISTEWTQYHRDASRSGLGPAEPAITSPKESWIASVDGDVYASPLIVAGHVIVATENNTVYSLDLFTGSVVWKVRLGDPVDARSLPCGNISPVTGITGTPAADIAGGKLYVVAYLRSHHHMLFALNLVDGSTAWQQDVDPSGSNPLVQQFRGALAIGNGLVYVPVGGLFGDCGQYHGYVVGVPLGGGQARAFQVGSARGASVWSAQGVSIASDGSVYFTTGNAFGSGFNYSNSVLQVAPDLTSVKSYFAPSNWAALDASDIDLGSVGATLLSGGHVLVIGKAGVAYLLREGSLGGIGGEITSRHVCSGAWGGTAWVDTTVFVPCLDGLYALSVGSTINVLWHNANPVLGSPIVSAGAVWAIEPDAGELYALSPTDGHVLFSTGLGAAMHFTTPAATDGYVVVPAGQKVVGLSVIG
jgi:outer membrane protein assembly factor BamB